jgi:hypothetical protein
MPTFLFFKNGTKVGDVIGPDPGALQTKIQELLEQEFS